MPNADFKLLSAYINNNLVEVTDYEEALDELIKLADFIDQNKNYFKHYLLYELVEDNILLNSILKVVVDNLDDFNNLEGIFDSETAILFVRAYAMQKGLIETNLDEFKEVQGRSTKL